VTKGKSGRRGAIAGIKRPESIAVKKERSLSNSLIAAVSGVLIAAIGAISTIAVAQISREKPVSDPPACTAVLDEYQKMIQNDPKWVEVLTKPGDDGVVPIAADPNARRCGFDAGSIRDLKP
jgi:hypothetical protein